METLTTRPSVAILIRGLINKPFDLKYDRSDKGRQDQEAQNGHESTILNGWVHPNQRDQQQRRNAQSDCGKDVERVRWLF